MHRGINGIVAAMQRRKGGSNAITARQEDVDVMFRPKLVPKLDTASLTAQLGSASHEEAVVNNEEDSEETPITTPVPSHTSDESQLVVSEELEPSLQQEGPLVTSPAEVDPAVVARKIWSLPNKKAYFSLPAKGGRVTRPKKKRLRNVTARNNSTLFHALRDNQDWPRYIPKRARENNVNDWSTIEETERQSSDEDDPVRSEYVSWLLFGNDPISDENGLTLEQTAKHFSGVDENETVEYANLTTSDDCNGSVDRSLGETSEEEYNYAEGHEDSLLDVATIDTERRHLDMTMAQYAALNVNPYEVETAGAYFAEVLFQGGLLPAGPNQLSLTFDDQSVFKVSYRDGPNANPTTETQDGGKRKRESDEDDDVENKRYKCFNE